MTNEEWQALYDGFERTWLLEAVKKIDEVRCHLSDGANREPPQIRTDLLNLHQLAMDVVNKGGTEKAQVLFDMASDLEMQVSDMIEAMESVQRTLDKLMALHPESLIDG